MTLSDAISNVLRLQARTPLYTAYIFLVTMDCGSAVFTYP